VIVKENLSRFRAIKAGDTVEEGCLASTVGSDDAVDAMFFDDYVQVTNGNQPTEAFRNFLCRENSHLVFLLDGCGI
jgi:hypothetical protein